MREDLLSFCQYILDQWELDTKDIQGRAEKLVKKYGGMERGSNENKS